MQIILFFGPSPPNVDGMLTAYILIWLVIILSFSFALYLKKTHCQDLSRFRIFAYLLTAVLLWLVGVTVLTHILFDLFEIKRNIKFILIYEPILLILYYVAQVKFFKKGHQKLLRSNWSMLFTLPLTLYILGAFIYLHASFVIESLPPM